MTQILKKINGYKALTYLGEKVILCKLNRLYISDYSLSRIDFICEINVVNIWFKIFSRFRLLQRLFRLELGPAISLNEKNKFLVFYGGKSFCVDVSERNVLCEQPVLMRRNPLQICLLKSSLMSGVIYVGEYNANFAYEPVNIYKRSTNGIWSIAFTFPAGQINHVHGIFEDITKNCIYILTGDFGVGAAIWVADLNLQEVKPLIRSGQDSRACWILPKGDELIFATDQQSEYNYLCVANQNPQITLQKKFPLAGSSIFFSSAHADKLIFSTAVEPISSNRFSLRRLIFSRRSKGMLSDRSCVYQGSFEEGFQIIFSDKKDSLPFGLFQFGNISFPSGDSCDKNFVHFYCTALKKSDNVTYAIKKINKDFA